MPEILEVESYRRLAAAVVGRQIVMAVLPDEWYVKRADPEEVRLAITGRHIEAVRRVGKLLVLDLDDGHRLGLRFGMTGRLLVDGLASIERLEYASARGDSAWDRLVLLLDKDGDLRVHDPRRLGGVELDPDEGRLGSDALTVTPDEVATALRGSTAPIKARLLDQSRIAGIGNLLADEILWRAGVDPGRPAGSLTPEAIGCLHREIGATLAELMSRGGSHTGDLRAAVLDDGHCPRDGAPLQRRRIGGRTTWSCPNHQS